MSSARRAASRRAGGRAASPTRSLVRCAGGVLALGPGPLGYATFLAACGLASALACAFVALRMVRARRNAVLAFDRDGIRYRLRGHDTSLRWLDLSAAFATPAGRRFVVLLIPRDGSDLRGPLALPSHSEFRAHELIALVRAFGAIGPEAKRPSPSR
jgi:hypothetical protein